MERLAAGMSYADLKFQDTDRIIATAVLQGPGGVALIDPGPTSTWPTLRSELKAAGITLADVTAIVLTHIHLDHAGATGSLVRENPRLRVYVHEKGAPHMADPEKLLASATRLYGDQMNRLWGEVRPVPRDAIVVVKGEEQIEAGGRVLQIAYTPGHASHHVSYFSADTGIAFVGDTAGIKRSARGYVLPPTPPPDIDLEAWNSSLTRISAWHPETLFLTHFGPASPSGPHIAELRGHLDIVSALAARSLAREGDEESQAAWFTEELRLELRRRMGDRETYEYEIAGPFNLNWRGLARYLRKGLGARGPGG
jgi:glyoxylase-like metal-dependent hydrolase (beta-lactamase superfamily II)